MKKIRTLNKYELAVKAVRKNSAYRDGRMVVQVMCWLIMIAGVAAFFKAFLAMEKGWVIDGVAAVLLAGGLAMLVSAIGSAFFDIADMKVRNLEE